MDTAFEAVIDACADPVRPDGWITSEVRAAYVRLHQLGWAHSVETWDSDHEELVGGLYGVAIGGLFAGESMFHRCTDTSKVALVGLVRLLRTDDVATVTRSRVLDVQWMTPHLASLGAIEISRGAYVERVRRAVRLPLPPAFGPHALVGEHQGTGER